MLPDELARQIEEIILAAEGKFINSMGRFQNGLYEQLLVIIKDLEVDTEGYILQNAANRRVLAEAENKLSEVFSSRPYQGAVEQYVFTIPKIDELNQSYFTTMPRFKENKQFLKSLQAQTIQTIERYILQDGLQSQVIDPLVQIMNQNVNIGGKFSGFLKQVQDYIKGNEKVEGRALRYSRNFLKDSLFQYSRSYQESVTRDLKLDWYLYSGGLIDTSREFCIERNGQYFRRSEVESWASQSWAGRHASTTESSIFVFCGGYGCGHSLIPVDESIVPVEFKD
jgi:hypothetical protein